MIEPSLINAQPARRMLRLRLAGSSRTVRCDASADEQWAAFEKRCCALLGVEKIKLIEAAAGGCCGDEVTSMDQLRDGDLLVLHAVGDAIDAEAEAWAQLLEKQARKSTLGKDVLKRYANRFAADGWQRPSDTAPIERAAFEQMCAGAGVLPGHRCLLQPLLVAATPEPPPGVMVPSDGGEGWPSQAAPPMGRLQTRSTNAVPSATASPPGSIQLARASKPGSSTDRAVSYRFGGKQGPASDGISGAHEGSSEGGWVTPRDDTGNWPKVVISYQSKDEAELADARDLLQGWGLNPWDGSQVTVGNWVPQWIEAAESEDTALIVFLMSETFLESAACLNELQHVCSSLNLLKKTLPIVLNEATAKLIQQEPQYMDVKFGLTRKNYKVKSDVTGDWDEVFRKLVMIAWAEAWPTEPPPTQLLPKVGKTIAEIEEELSSLGQTQRLRIKGNIDPNDEEEQPLQVGFIGSVNHEFSCDANGQLDQGAFASRVLKALGERLANLEIRKQEEGAKLQRVVATSGGFKGVGQEVMQAFADECERMNRPGPSACAVLPLGGYTELGEALFAHAGVVAPLAVRDKTVWTPSSLNPTDDDDRVFGSAKDRDEKTGRVPILKAGFEDRMVAEYGADWRMEAGFGAWGDNRMVEDFKVGADVGERERYLALTMPVLVMVEGGPGALNEAKIAMQNKRFVLPIGCLGGNAQVVGSDGHKARWVKQSNLTELYKSLQMQAAITQADTGKSCKLEGDKLIVDGEERSVVWRTGWHEKGTMKTLKQVDCEGEILSVEEGVQGTITVGGARQEPISFENPLLPLSLSPEEIADKVCTLIAKLPASIEKRTTISQEELEVKLGEWSKHLPNSLELLHSPEELEAFIFKKRADESVYRLPHVPDHGVAVALDGHGSRNEFYNGTPDVLAQRLKPVFAYIDEQFGKGNWVLLTGGDPHTDKHDTGCLLHVARERLGIRCVAVQCHDYASMICTPDETTGDLVEEYSYLKDGAVMPYRTTYRMDAAGLEEIQYGGYDAEQELVGASKYWFHEKVRELVVMDVACGGGPIARNNITQCLFGNLQPGAREHNRAETAVVPDTTDKPPSTRCFLPIPVIYLPFRAKNCGPGRESGSWMGQVHDFLNQPKIKKLANNHEDVRRLLDSSPDSVWVLYDPRKTTSPEKKKKLEAKEKVTS